MTGADGAQTLQLFDQTRRAPGGPERRYNGPVAEAEPARSSGIRPQRCPRRWGTYRPEPFP